MASTRVSISKPSKRLKINIIPLKQLFIDLTNDDTKTPSPNYQVLSPSAPNAPSKTPSTIATSSSSIDHKPKSPRSFTSPSSHGYLNSSMSSPLRVPPPPPTQESGSMDITLTLSPITSLDRPLIPNNIKGKEHGKKLYDSVINGPVKYRTVEVPGTLTTHASIIDRTYDNLTEPEKIREAFDIRETNTVLQGLPHNIYNLERELKLYDEFDTFTSEKGETIHLYYLWFAQLINDMHTIEMSMQPLQGRQTQGYAGSGARSNVIGTGVNRNGESNIVDQKILLAQALEAGVALDEEHMVFLADNGDTITTGQESQEIPTPAIFQTDDLVAFDSDYDEAPSASVVLMAKLSAYDSNILSKVPYLDTYQTNNAIDQSVQEIQYSKQPPFINDSDIDITNDSNVISYDQYLQETKNAVVQDTNSSTQQDAMIMYVIEEMSNQIAKCNEVNKVYKTVKESLTAKFDKYKEQIKFFEERHKVDLTDREKYINSQMRGVIVDRNAKFANFQN
ncbi:hypothetical protein Tco_0843434 [Tanacetum coccineum]|uniref:Uncharacterized protein n=1 Tax=Tanacetum coccineum TaxID=301880 RepID=A0ABQ5B4A5_9ASTR